MVEMSVPEFVNKIVVDNEGDFRGIELPEGTDLTFRIPELNGAFQYCKSLRGGVDLSDAVLRGLKAPGLCINAPNFSNTDLRDANLTNARLPRANLSNANLSNASLYNVDLYQAILNGARVKGANAYGANFSAADLSGLAGLESLSWVGQVIMVGTILTEEQAEVIQKLRMGDYHIMKIGE